MVEMKKLIYILLFLFICLIPSAGFLFGGTAGVQENKKDSKIPALKDEEGEINVHYLSDMGTWFEKNFAFRSVLVSVHAEIFYHCFGMSAQKGVIAGTDGWLYYKDSLEDYQGKLMSRRQLFQVAHSLKMIQDYAENSGVKFIFAPAPNKNSLYGGNMPYYYKKFHGTETNLTLLYGFLNSEGVNYADLRGTLANEGKVLYHKRDSHWTNEGAAIAADVIMSGLGWEHEVYRGRSYSIRKDFEGDLEGMLFPAWIRPEEEIYYEPMPEFTYVEEVENNFAPRISTRSAADGNLLMYRDSFGNALLPFFAESYGKAYFSRSLPYYLPELEQYGADTLVIERAERFLPEMAEKPPFMEAMEVDSDTQERADFAPVSPEVKEEGEYIRISGTLDEAEYNTRILIRIRVCDEAAGEYVKKCYEAFPYTDGEGREAYTMVLKKGELGEAEYELGLVE